MPCDSVISITQAGPMDATTLMAALEALKMRPSRTQTGIRFQRGFYDIESGELCISGYSQDVVNGLRVTIRKAYTREAVATAARRQGLRVQLDSSQPDRLTIRTGR